MPVPTSYVFDAPCMVGVISDTHGLLRPEALAALRGCHVLLHAGDVGSQAILRDLRAVAPIHVARGNVDQESWAWEIPWEDTIEIDGHVIHVVHDVARLATHAAPPDTAAVVFGHSHAPVVEHRDGVLFVNPGSAGPRRFRLPISVARIRVSREGLAPEIVVMAR